MNTTIQVPVDVFGGCPACFRGLVHSVSAGAYGYRDGYRSCGWQLASHLGSNIPDTADWGRWIVQVDELDRLFRERDFDQALTWFLQRYPRCMKCVPVRRRKNFIRGAFEYWDEGGSLL
jgi:hypothetical protein